MCPSPSSNMASKSLRRSPFSPTPCPLWLSGDIMFTYLGFLGGCVWILKPGDVTKVSPGDHRSPVSHMIFYGKSVLSSGAFLVRCDYGGAAFLVVSSSLCLSGGHSWLVISYDISGKRFGWSVQTKGPLRRRRPRFRRVL